MQRLYLLVVDVAICYYLAFFHFWYNPRPDPPINYSSDFVGSSHTYCEASYQFLIFDNFPDHISPIIAISYVWMQICNAVAVAKILNATLILPVLKQDQIWKDQT